MTSSYYYGSLDVADGGASSSSEQHHDDDDRPADDSAQKKNPIIHHPSVSSIALPDQQRTAVVGRNTYCSTKRRAHSVLLLLVAAAAAALTALLLVIPRMTNVFTSSSTLQSSTGAHNEPLAMMMMMVQRDTNNNNNNNKIKNGKKKQQQRHQCIFTNVHCNSHRQQQNECYIKPSEYEACLQSIRLDATRVRQTIRSLDDIFAQHYPFYYLANSPNRTAPSIPSSPGQQQRFRIYDRAYDLRARLRSLLPPAAEIEKAPPPSSSSSSPPSSFSYSVAALWSVTAAFNLLRDAHVRAVQGTIGRLDSELWSGLYEMVVLPSSVLRNMHHQQQPHNALLQTDFYYYHPGKNGDDATNGSAAVVGLDLWRYCSSNDTDNLLLYDKQRVTRVDGWSPEEFVLRLANDAPLASLSFKSVGPRVNALLARNFPTAQPATALFRTRPGRRERIWPSAIVPRDSFYIEYDSNSKGRGGKSGREEFEARIVITPSDYSGAHDLLHQKTAAANPSGARLVVDITDIEKAANEPSCLYRNYRNGMKKAGEAVARAKPSVRQRSLADTASRSVAVNADANREIASKNDSKDILDQYCSCSEDGWFTKHYNCSGFAPPFDDDGPLEVGYKVVDDSFVVLWIDSFDAPPAIIFPLWSEITHAARKAGVDRLMIDISNNGGGEVPMGLNLARLLYPEVECDYFDNAYDMVYNRAMRVWANDVDPLLRQIESELLKGNVMLGSEMLTALAKATAKHRRDMVHRAEAMCIFALDRKDKYCGMDAKATIQANCTLYSAAVQFDRDPSLASLNQFFREYLLAMRSGNPWTVYSKFDVSDDIEQKTYLRGGVMANFTGFLKHEPDLPVWWNCSLEPVNDEENVFSQYMLVSNGNAGSTTNTFQTTVEQLWKNREITKARRPLTTVSYGGVKGDTPLTQYAGGTVDHSVNVEDAFVGLVGLRLLLEFVCGCAQDFLCSQVNAAFDLLSDSLPEVPYYLEKFPALPAVEIYNRFMLLDGGATIPLEFVFMPPDVYIEQMFFGTASAEGKSGSLPSSRSMQDLYEEASRSFQKPLYSSASF